ncbi:MAG: acryloyl-CoA reductase [Planctomycetota bacterium]|nr:MAG: acryloyl-CoA reductase [Planctomycetota bacterium]
MSEADYRNLCPEAPEVFRCLRVEKTDDGVSCRVTECRKDELPPGEVIIRVVYSSVNYKDALAASGHPGIVKSFPHVPGVDAAGVVADSGAFEFVPGDKVLVTGFDMGAARWGGFCEYIRVPQDWIILLPPGMKLRESMIWGTAGLTAAMCVNALRNHGVMPESGPVVVSGATGGVGSTAIAILGKLGYHVAAVTGKSDAEGWLKKLGAAEVLPRETLSAPDEKPMLSARWAGGIDTVGTRVLTTMLRATKHSGCVAACGLAGGPDLHMTVYPFILRGITLAGIDAAYAPDPLRHGMWEKLAEEWKPDCLDEIVTREATLEELPEVFEAMLAGKVRGRTIVRIGDEPDDN